MRWTEAQLSEHLARRATPAETIKPASTQRKRAGPRIGIETDESSIHRAVVEHLRTRAHPGISWFHVPNGELRDPGTAVKLKAMGTRPGVPDLLLLIAGRLHGLELKRDRGGRLSDTQYAMHAELIAAGAIVVTACGLDEAIETLTGWGAFKPTNRKAGS